MIICFFLLTLFFKFSYEDKYFLETLGGFPLHGLTIIRIPSGGYYAASTYENEDYSEFIFIFKLDSEGKIIWSKSIEIEDTKFSTKYLSLALTSDGFFMAGQLNYYEPLTEDECPKPFISKITDEETFSIDLSMIGINDCVGEFITDVYSEDSTEAVVTGYTKIDGKIELFVATVSVTGSIEIISSFAYPVGGNDISIFKNSFIMKYTAYFLVFANINTTDQMNVLMISVKTTLDEIYLIKMLSPKLPHMNMDISSAVRSVDDVILTGNIYSNDRDRTKDMIFLSALYYSGGGGTGLEYDWGRAYKGGIAEKIRFLNTTKNEENLVIVGRTNPNDTSNSRALGIKLSLTGDIMWEKVVEISNSNYSTIYDLDISDDGFSFFGNIMKEEGSNLVFAKVSPKGFISYKCNEFVNTNEIEIFEHVFEIDEISKIVNRSHSLVRIDDATPLVLGRNLTTEIVCSGCGFGCEIYDCFGVLSNYSNVCSSHGECILNNTCNCSINYSGEKCDVFSCYDILNNDSDVCDGHGNCTAYDTCSCDYNFDGEICELCFAGYYGPNCNIPRCGGILANNTPEVIGLGKAWETYVCSGHGICREPDECECSKGEIYQETRYLGEFCEKPICFNVDIPENACSFHGDCYDYNDCGCDNEYFGPKCEERIERPYFTNYHVNVLTMNYIVQRDVFMNHGKQDMTNKGFNCSLIIRNWKPYFNHKTSNCYFDISEVVSDFFFALDLVLVIAELEEIYGPDYSPEAGQFYVDDPLIEYKLPDNFSLEIITISKPEDIVKLLVVPFPDIDGGNDHHDDSNKKETNLTWLYITLPLSLSFLFCVSFVAIIFITIFVCVCLCFVVFAFVLAIIVFVSMGGGGGFLGFTYLKRKTRKFDKIDHLLKERLLDDGDENKARITIDKSLFEINYKDIKVLNSIGSGGSNSIVFSAIWKGSVAVAFKCFQTTEVFSSEEMYKEFEKEVKVISSIRHPNCLTFYGCTLHPPRIGIVMEYCSNGDLVVFLENYTNYEMNERFRILSEVCKAMVYLHDRNVIHRDLKSENVLLTKDEVAKVIDFGLSKIATRMSVEKTKKIGTSCYMAPEVVLGEKYNEKCDIFSFGIVMWEVICGSFNPYGVKSSFNIEYKVANNPKYRPVMTGVRLRLENHFKEDISGFTEEVCIIMESCWDHKPIERPTFEELSAKMKEIVEGI